MSIPSRRAAQYVRVSTDRQDLSPLVCLDAGTGEVLIIRVSFEVGTLGIALLSPAVQLAPSAG